MLAAGPATGVLNQDAPHRFGGRGEEVPSVIPVADLTSTRRKIGLVNQRGGLKRLIGLLLGHLLGRQLRSSS